MRILYLAVAEGRGHLMRAQLLSHQLQAQGHQVEIITTAPAGVEFLKTFGIQATVFSDYQYMAFDKNQNMQAVATDLKTICYFFLPWNMLKDIFRLKRKIKQTPYDLIINDSLQPALISAPFFGVKNIVHIHGETLHTALYENFKGRLPNFLANGFGKSVNYFLSRAKTQLLHSQDIEYPEKVKNGWRLPNPIQAPDRTADNTWKQYHFQPNKPLALIYLNPHFQDNALIERLEKLFNEAGWQFMGISEQYADRPHWHKYTNDFANLTYAADLLVSAGGMAALRLAKLNQCPLLALDTAQPEQQHNLSRFSHAAPYSTLQIANDDSWQQSALFLTTLKNNRHTKPILTEVQRCVRENTNHWLTLLEELINTDSAVQEK